MSYTCGTVFYGIPLHFANRHQEHSAFMTSLKNDYEDDDEKDGFHRFYDGGADEQPMAFGVQLANFEVTSPFIDLTQECFNHLMLDYSSRFKELWNKLDEQTQLEFGRYGEPRLFVLWSSS